MRSAFLAFAGSLALGATPASATLIDFTMTFDGVQADTTSGGTGSGTATLDTDTNLFSWTISFQDLEGLSALAHFHKGAPGDNNGPIQIDTPIPQLVTAATDVTGSATISDLQEADLLAGLWYHNIHSLFDLTGEIRAQVIPVPEPASALLLAGALAGLARARQRRAARAAGRAAGVC